MGAVLDDAVGQHDARLIARHRDGDESAFEALYNAYHEQLTRFVRRQVREADMVEDITQEAFARAYAAIDKLRDPSRFYPWLSVIARRLVMDHYRLRVRVTAVAELDPGQTEPCDGDLMRRLTHADVATALLRVRPRHRQILRMREVERLSYDVIAKRLGVPETTVPPLLWRARLALRREYLAITQEERSWLALPGMYLVLDALRRARDRVMQVAAYLPDPQVITGSVAAVAITVGVIAGSHDLVRPAPATDGRSELFAPIPSSAAVSDAESPSRVEDSHEHAARGVAGLSNVNFDAASARSGRRHDEGTSAYYFEVGEHSVAVDPGYVQRSIGSSLAGNHEWMRGEGDPCVSDSASCS